MRLNQVTVGVTDIARAVDFYRRLGLAPVVPAVQYERFVCSDGQVTFSIERAAAVTPGEKLVYFECDDLDDRVTALKAVGMVFNTEPEDRHWVWRAARLADPDGNQLCLFFAGKNRLDPPWRA